MSPATQAARATARPDAIERQAQQFISRSLERAQARLSNIITVSDGLQRLVQAAESGALGVRSGKLQDLRKGRQAVAELAQQAEQEVARLRAHERSVQP